MTKEEALGQIPHQIHELHRHLKGGTIDPSNVSIGLRRIVDGVQFLLVDKTKDGWVLVSDTDQPDGPDGFDVRKIKSQRLVDWNENNHKITYEEVKRRATLGKSLCGQRHAEMICLHQSGLPETIARKGQLVFPGTVWENEGKRYCPCLKHKESGFYLDFKPIENGWGSMDFLVLPL